jgi:hypothetical protein
MIVQKVHAALINFHLVNGVTSKLKIVKPSGISLSCFVQPFSNGAFSQVSIISPTLAPFHARTYLFSPSL